MTNPKAIKFEKYCGGVRIILAIILLILSAKTIQIGYFFVVSLGLEEKNFTITEDSQYYWIRTNSKAHNIEINNVVSKWAVPDFIADIDSIEQCSIKTLNNSNLALTICLVLMPVLFLLAALAMVLTHIINEPTPFMDYNIKWLKIIGSVLIYFGFAMKTIFIMILWGLIFANIFDYGQYLQQEYDETL